MQVMIKLEKEDIVTSWLGENVVIKPSGGPMIILSQEAARELADDIEVVLVTLNIRKGE